MSWRIEKWYSEVFPGEKGVFDSYKRLTLRELAIVAASPHFSYRSTIFRYSAFQGSIGVFIAAGQTRLLDFA